ncbi:MAG: DUF4493 domain-containing protein [Muribaculaceae bacterium]|nr:DUF4493 domain-containing protein [Muribaculaceae bacterium]
MRFLKPVLLCASLSLLAGCMDESPFYSTDSGKGKINLNLSAASDVKSELPETRSVSADIIAPDASLFQIRLSSADGSYIKTWSSLADFEKEESFSAGEYDLEAFYGSPSSQGVVEENEKGHEHAYYYGIHQSLQIESDKTTMIQLEAKLSNSVVLLEYTDAFKKYFKNWETTLKTDGAAQVALEDKECLTYIKSGNVNLTIKAELQNGNLVRMTPTSFEALPQHLYSIRYNINNGEIGDVDKLQIVFNDDLENENNIEIDLTEEFFTGAVPIVTLEGLENLETETLEMLEGYPFEETLKFTINAAEKIGSVKLFLTSEDYVPAIMSEGELELFGIDEATQTLISGEGIRSVGLYNNPDKLALVDVTDFCRSLPVGQYELSLVAADKYGREGEPSSFKLTVCPVDIQLSQVEEGEISFGVEEVEVKVSYNGPTPTIDGPFSFKVGGKLMMEDVEIVSIEKAPQTRSFDSQDYIFRLKLPKVYRDDYPVTFSYRNVEVKDQSITITVNYPVYEMEYDRVGNIIMMRVKDDNEKIKDAAIDHLRVIVNDEYIKPSQIEYNQIENFFTVSGLKYSDVYKVKTTICTGETPTSFSPEVEVTKEEGEGVPNGSFEETVSAINRRTVQRGGVYYKSLVDQNHKDSEDYIFNMPAQWNSVNDKTCNFEESSNINTWFLVASTFSNSGKNGNGVSIRSVGFNYNGSDPEKDSGSTLNRPSYNGNSPSKGNTAAGKLFLGSYEIDIQNYSIVSENYTQGYPFTSRPVKFKGYFKYSPYDNDRGKVLISIKKGDTILASGEYYFESASDWSEFEIPLNTNYTFKSYPDSLEIMFMSSDKGSENWREENSSVPTQAITENTQKFLGSELIIDDLSFDY